MPNENKKLSAEKQLKIEISHIFDSGANEIRVFNLVKQQTASLEAEVKRLHQELDLRCAHVIAKDELLSRLTNKHEADLQDLENENDDLLLQTEKQSVNNIAMQMDYEALKERVDALQGSLIKSTQETEDLKQKADRLYEALKTISSGDIGPIGLHKAQQAITNYEKQE